MNLHVPGLVWAAAFFLAALLVRLLPEPPPARQVTDKYLHVPSTFPMHLANRGLHRPMTGAASGMTPGMEPYGPAGVPPRRGSMRTMSRSLALWGLLFLAGGVLPAVA